MAESRIEVKGLKQLNRTIKAKMKVLKGDRRLLDAIGMMVVRDIKKIFQIGGDPKWKESGRAGKAGKVKRGKRKGESIKGKTLIKTGRLRNSITHRVEGSGARSKVLVGTNVIYAKTHNFGRPKDGIEQREFFIIRPGVSKRILNAVDKAFKAAK